MTVDLSIIGVAFAAFCVWLTVRIVNRRERWAKWTLVAALLLPVLFVLGLGPAAWYYENYHDYVPQWLTKTIQAVYSPLIGVMFRGPE